ncbi:MAG: STAS domain-containing protein [Anaerolineae bacterium]
MEIKYRTSHGVHVLELNGRFDAYEVPAVVKWFEDHPTARNVLINMQGVGFIDSSGISTLVKGLKRCRQNGGDLYISNLQQAVFIIFELTRMDKALNIYPDEAAALNTIPA